MRRLPSINLAKGGLPTSDSYPEWLRLAGQPEAGSQSGVSTNTAVQDPAKDGLSRLLRIRGDYGWQAGIGIAPRAILTT